jgi:hypothetical protein
MLILSDRKIYREKPYLDAGKESGLGGGYPAHDYME